MTLLDQPAAAPAPEDPQGPSVRRQILRGTAFGTALVLLVVLVGVGITYGAHPASELWAQAFGDPGIGLADGVTLSDDRPVADVPMVAEKRWDLDDPASIAVLAAPLGGVVRRISAAAEAQAWRDENAGGSLTEGTIEGPVDTPTFLTPAGLVQVWQFEGAPDSVDLTGADGEGAIRATSRAERESVALALVRAWSGPSSMPLAVSETTGESSASVKVVRTGEQGLGFGQDYVAYLVFRDGALRFATVSTVSAAGSERRILLSPAEAFDGVRHHRAGLLARPEYVPVVRAELTYDLSSTDSGGAAFWTFYGADGDAAWIAPADPDASPGDVPSWWG
jgi:hypothetical protein